MPCRIRVPPSPEQHHAHLNHRGRALSSSWRSSARASSAPSVVLRRRPTSCSSVVAPIFVQISLGASVRCGWMSSPSAIVACSPVAQGSWSDVQCSAIRPSALQFASRCVDHPRSTAPVPPPAPCIPVRGARSTPHWRRAVQSVCASSTPPIPKPISLPPRTRSQRSLAHQAAGGLRRPQPDQRQGEVRIHQPRLPLPQCGRAADAVRQGGACSAALTAEQRTH